MIAPGGGTRIHLAVEPVDFRKSFNGLSLIVVDALGRDPLSGEVFVFRNRRGDKLKCLYWDGQGFVLAYKRLEQGVFPWPRQADGAVRMLSRPQLEALFDGLAWWRLAAPQRCRASAIA